MMEGNRGWIYLGSLIFVICGGLMILLKDFAIGILFISLGLIFLIIPNSTGAGITASKPKVLPIIIIVVGIGVTILLIATLIFGRP